MGRQKDLSDKDCAFCGNAKANLGSDYCGGACANGMTTDEVLNEAKEMRVASRKDREDMYRNEREQIIQEKAMQEFEHLQAVEYRNSFNDWIEGPYYHYSKEMNLHLVDLGFTMVFIKDSDIRPVQLICDEAREQIKQALLCAQDIKFIFSGNEFDEYLDLNPTGENALPSVGWQVKARIGGVYITNGVTRHMTSGNNALPELDLSTGKVTEYEGEKEKEDILVDSVRQGLINDLKKYKQFYHSKESEIIHVRGICDDKDVDIAGQRRSITTLTNAIKEKDNIIEELKNRYQRDVNILKEKHLETQILLSNAENLCKEKDAEIKELDALLNSKDVEKSGIRTEYVDLCAEKDAEIERLKALARRAIDSEKTKDTCIKRLEKSLGRGSNIGTELNKALKEVDRLNEACSERYESMVLIRDECAKYIID